MTPLKHISCLFVFVALMSGAHAATVDLTDGLFTVIEPAMDGGTSLGVPRVFTETADGVVFTFTATNNLAATPRFNDLTNIGIGIQLDGGGQSVIEFTLDSYSTIANGFFLGAATFDVAGASLASAGNTLPEDVAANVFTG
ncbi:MAG: hypothetical protein ACU85U_19980 [Gammaproteobacteria bacterium]|jgi:hypothetical protein